MRIYILEKDACVNPSRYMTGLLSLPLGYPRTTYKEDGLRLARLIASLCISTDG